MVARKLLPGGVTRLESDRASVEVSMASPTALLWSITGHGDGPTAESITAEMDRLMGEATGILLFNDCAGLTSYDTAFRVVLTEWTRRNQARVASTHVLVRSKLVAMGVSVANLALGGGMHSYSERGRFEAALAATGTKVGAQAG